MYNSMHCVGQHQLFKENVHMVNSVIYYHIYTYLVDTLC